MDPLFVPHGIPSDIFNNPPNFLTEKNPASDPPQPTPSPKVDLPRSHHSIKQALHFSRRCK
jgi:hypothetical protein